MNAGGFHFLGLSTEILEHARVLREAVWTFLVLRDWQSDREGNVLAGGDVRAAGIAERLHLNERTVRQHLVLLERHGYIGIHRTRSGRQVRILRFAGRPHGTVERTAHAPQRELPFEAAGEPPAVIVQALAGVSGGAELLRQLIQMARAAAQHAGEIIKDEEIATLFQQIRESGSRDGIRNLAYFRTVLPDRIQGYLLERRQRGKGPQAVHGGTRELSPGLQRFVAKHSGGEPPSS